MKNRRVVVGKRGGPEVMHLIEEQAPEPGQGQVRVKVLTAGVSAYDVMLRSKWLPGFPRLPFTPGVDIVGVIDKLGDGVIEFEEGQRVAASLGLTGGGYAKYVCLSAAGLAIVPPGVDSAEAVCVVVNYLTADLMMNGPGQVKTGERVLVHGAAGGVGTALLQLGQLAGLEMYGTASSHDHEIVTALGATPIDYRNEDFVRRIKSMTGDGVDVVFDPIGGGRQLWRSYRTLRPGGRLVWFGVAASARSGIRVIPLSLITRLVLSLIPDGKAAPLSPTADPETEAERLTSLLELLSATKITPVIGERLPLSQAVRAHQILEDGTYVGKLVLDVADAASD